MKDIGLRYRLYLLSFLGSLDGMTMQAAGCSKKPWCISGNRSVMRRKAYRSSSLDRVDLQCARTKSIIATTYHTIVPQVHLSMLYVRDRHDKIDLE